LWERGGKAGPRKGITEKENGAVVKSWLNRKKGVSQKKKGKNLNYTEDVL